MSPYVVSRFCRSSTCCRLLIIALLVVSVSSAATKLFKCPEKFGYFPDETECSKYFMCVFGDAFHERCTGGLHFSPSRRICDWPRNAHCEKGNGVQDASASTLSRSGGKGRFGNGATVANRNNNALLSRAGSRYQVTEDSLPAYTRAPVRLAPTLPPIRTPVPTERTHPVLTPAPETRYSPRIINTRLVALTEASRPPGYYNINKKPESLQPVTEEDDDYEEDDSDEEGKDINIYVRPIYDRKGSREEAVGIKEQREPDPESLVVVLTNNGKYKDQDVSIQRLPDITKPPEDNNPIYVRKAEIAETDYKNNIRRSPSISHAFQSIQTPNRQPVSIPSRQPTTHGFGRPRAFPETSAARPINGGSKDVPINSRQIINPIYNPSKNAITRPNPIRTNGRTPLTSRQGSTYLASINRSPDVPRHTDNSNRGSEYSRRGSTYVSSNNRAPDAAVRQDSYSNSRRASEIARQQNSDNSREIARQQSYSPERRAPETYHSSFPPRRLPDVPRATAYNPPRRIAPSTIPTPAERNRYLPQTVATSRQVTPTPTNDRTTPQTSFRQQLSVYLKRVPEVSVPSAYNSGNKARNSEDIIPVSRTRTVDSDVSSVQSNAYGVPKQSLDNSDSLDAQYGTNPTSVRLPDNPIRVQSFQYNKDEAAKKRGYPNNQASQYHYEDEQGDYPEYYFDDDEEEEDEADQQRTTPRPVRLTTPIYRPPPPPPTTTTTTTTTTRPPPTRPSKRRLPTGISRPATRAPSIYAGRPPPPASRPPPVYATPRPFSAAGKCSTSKCRLPDCYCGTTDPPNGMAVSDIPQLVLLTFDDAMNDLNFELYSELFGERRNPNGCPALGTFYVSHEWTDYGKVQTMYSLGHEMASHGVTHSFGEKFSVELWHKEIHGQREILHLFAGVKMEDVRGMRAPFLQTGGNKMFEMLYQANFTYDSSLPVPEGNPPMWPYTLDYQLGHPCMIPPCPTKAFPGLWEVGMIMWTDLRGGRCSMADACTNPFK